MKCPLDVGVDLVMTERQGVEIDYCPTCRGVWLDRGELDKILDRAAELAPAPGAAGPAAAVPPPHDAGRPTAGGYGVGGYPPAGAYGDDDRRHPRPDDRPRYDDRRDDDDDRRRYGDDRSRYGRPGHDPRKKRKESWLGDLLDFG